MHSWDLCENISLKTDMSKRTYSSDIRQMAMKVMTFNNREYQKGSLSVCLDAPLRRTSEMTGIPRQTLRRWELRNTVNNKK